MTITRELLTPSEVATRMGVHVSTIHRHIRGGAIPLVGRKVCSEWLDDYMSGNTLPLCAHCGRYRCANPEDRLCVKCETLKETE